MQFRYNSGQIFRRGSDFPFGRQPHQHKQKDTLKQSRKEGKRRKTELHADRGFGHKAFGPLPVLSRYSHLFSEDGLS